MNTRRPTAQRRLSVMTLTLTIAMVVGSAGEISAATPRPTRLDPGTQVEASGHGRVRFRGAVNVSNLPGITRTDARRAPRLRTLRLDGSSRPGPVRDVRKPALATQPNLTLPTRIFQNFAGTSRAQASCACEPPDPNGAIGGAYDVEAVNLALAIYKRGTSALISRTSLATFLGTTDSLADPRVFYDNTWRRWVLVVILKPAATTSTPAIWVATSRTADPTAGWYRYRVTFGGPPFPLGTLLDFPMVSLDADSVVVATNNFQKNAGAPPFTYLNTQAFAIPKARVYNGRGFGFPTFAVDFGTHPAFLAGNPQANPGRTYLVASLIPYGLNSFDVYYMTNTSRPDSTILTYQGQTAAVGSGAPNPGQQPGGTQFDALDGRLQSAPFQLGNRLFWTRATGFPVIQYGTIDTGTLGLVSATAYVSLTSYDWNPSIGVADAGGGNAYMWLNWTYAIPASNVNISMRVAGLGPADAIQSLVGVGVTIATGGLAGATASVRRFGDYSSVSIDPAAASPCAANRSALVVNELISNGGGRSRLARIGFC